MKSTTNRHRPHEKPRLRLCTVLAVLVTFVTLTPRASAQNISVAFSTPGTLMWGNTCPAAPPASVPNAPTGPSQLNACGGGPDCLHRAVIDTNAFPNAVCNDGTPGVFYVRAGTGDDVNKWVIHLQGGGVCQDGQSCSERWCGQQGIYTANKMSTDWNGDGISDMPAHAAAGGMASMNPANNFRTWTHVWAYYCSSDSWMGRNNNVAFNGGVVPFTMHTRGHNILLAMRRMLRKKNAANPAWTAADGYSVPNLDKATDIIFSGTSAGAKGAIMNVDWFLAPFTNANRYFVLDANMDMSDTALISNDVWIDTDNDGLGDNGYYSQRITDTVAEWAPGGYFNDINAFTDTTCRAFYEPINRMDRCSQFSTMLRLNIGGVPIIETETFARVDLSDTVLKKRYIEHPNPHGFSLLIGGQSGTQINTDDFVVLMRQTLKELYDDHDSVTGLIAPKCGQHVGLEDGHTFFFKATPDTDDTATPRVEIPGTQTTVHDAIWDWLNLGGSPVALRRLDTDDPGVRFSVCL